MEAISRSAELITFLRKEAKQSDRTAWVRWREINAYLFKHNHELENTINRAVARGRRSGSEDIQKCWSALSLEEKQEAQKLIQLYLDLERDTQDIVTFHRCENSLKQLGIEWSLSSKDAAEVNTWLEKFKENRFEQKVNIPGTIRILLVDFLARVLLLYLQKAGVLTDLGYTLLEIHSHEGFFVLCQLLILPTIILTWSILRDKQIIKKAKALFDDLGRTDLVLKVHHSPWNYLFVFLMVLMGSFTPKLAFEWGNDTASQVALMLSIGLYGAYSLLILKHFSKRFPTGQMIARQLEKVDLEVVKPELSAEENDEEIIELGVNLRSSNEKMEAYVLEAALFGALAFSAFLQIISSGSLGLEQIETFTSMVADSLTSFLRNEASNLTLTDALLHKPNLLALMAYETLFCSSFFLAVIASRLRFNDLTDTIDRFLNLSRRYNEKEEQAIIAQLDNNKVNGFTKQIRRYLSLGNLSLEETKPIMEYMRFFRTLGISTFFLIVVTGGLFISLNLSLVLLFIAVLSLMFFQLDTIKQRAKNLSTRIQEFYFFYNKKVHILAWSAIGVALILRSIGSDFGAIVMVLSFSLLFLHYILSLFVPEQTKLQSPNRDLFGSERAMALLSGISLKVALAIFFLGYMAKAAHWPGASAALVLGSFLMIFHFLVSRKSFKAPKWVNQLVSLALATGMLGIIFRLQHWPGNGLLRYLSLLALTLAGILIYRHRKLMFPATRNAVIIMFALGVLSQFKSTSFMLTNLSFNFKAYEKAVLFEDLLVRISEPMSRGGYGDATAGASLDSLHSTIATIDSIADMDSTFSTEELNLMAWNGFLIFKDSTAKESALKWAKQSISKEVGYENMDTYAHILFATGRLEEAKAAAEKCLEIIEQNALDGDFSGTQVLLDSIHAALTKRGMPPLGLTDTLPEPNP